MSFNLKKKGTIGAAFPLVELPLSVGGLIAPLLDLIRPLIELFKLVALAQTFILWLLYLPVMAAAMLAELVLAAIQQIIDIVSGFLQKFREVSINGVFYQYAYTGKVEDMGTALSAYFANGLVQPDSTSNGKPNQKVDVMMFIAKGTAVGDGLAALVGGAVELPDDDTHPEEASENEVRGVAVAAAGKIIRAAWSSTKKAIDDYAVRIVDTDGDKEVYGSRGYVGEAGDEHLWSFDVGNGFELEDGHTYRVEVARVYTVDIPAGGPALPEGELADIIKAEFKARGFLNYLPTVGTRQSVVQKYQDAVSQGEFMLEFLDDLIAGDTGTSDQSKANRAALEKEKITWAANIAEATQLIPIAQDWPTRTATPPSEPAYEVKEAVWVASDATFTYSRPDAFPEPSVAPPASDDPIPAPAVPEVELLQRGGLGVAFPAIAGLGDFLEGIETPLKDFKKMVARTICRAAERKKGMEAMIKYWSESIDNLQREITKLQNMIKKFLAFTVHFKAAFQLGTVFVFNAEQTTPFTFGSEVQAKLDTGDLDPELPAGTVVKAYFFVCESPISFGFLKFLTGT